MDFNLCVYVCNVYVFFFVLHFVCSPMFFVYFLYSFYQKF